MVWLALALVALAALVLYHERRVRATPVLLLVRDRQEELEGLVRSLVGRGRLVFLVDLGSDDGTLAIAKRLAEDQPGVYFLATGNVADAIWSLPSPVVTVVSLLGPWEMKEIVRHV